MDALVRELIPHSPKLGLYVAPDVPSRMLDRARSSYAPDLAATEVLALYDATRLGTGGDGALFMADRLAFQNNNFERGQIVRYRDIVDVHARRRWLGGRYVELKVNRGRATVSVRLDFSGKPDAAAYVARFLQEAMLWEPDRHPDQPGPAWSAVEASLQRLVDEGKLDAATMNRMLDAGRRRS